MQRPNPSRSTYSRIVLAVGCLFLASPAAAQGTATLEGTIRTDAGTVLPSGITLRLETGEGELVAQQPANSNGQFEFDFLRKIHYRLTASADGFQTAEREIDLGYGANRMIVSLVLMPITKSKLPAAPLPTLNDNNASPKARKEYEKGARALEGKSLDEARTHFELAVAEYPCYARAQTDLALTLSSQRQYPQAEAALKKALECDPGYLDAYTQLGQLLNADKKFEDSRQVLERGLQRSGNAWQITYQLGVACYGLKQYSKAEENFLKVLSTNPAPPADIHIKLADVYLKEKAYDKAYAEMQAYLGAEPNGPRAAKIKDIMRQMEASGVLHAAPPASNPPPSTRP